MSGFGMKNTPFSAEPPLRFAVKNQKTLNLL
jgi:hypothetical protein